MNYVLAVLAFSAGLATGGLVVWLFMRARTTQLLERVSARDSKIVDLDLQVRDRDKQIDPLREEVTVLKTVRSELQTTLEKERISAEEKLALLNEAKIKLSDT